MDIFVGLTCADGRLHFETMQSLVEEQRLASVQGDRLYIGGVSGIPYIDRARNVVVNVFLEGSCDRMVFLDYDISWKPGSLLKLAHIKEPFVAAAYRFKQSLEEYPVAFWDQQTRRRDDRGLLLVRHVPFGFVALDRKVFETFEELSPHRTYIDRHRKPLYMFFYSPYVPGTPQNPGCKYEEDVAFCIEWQNFGGKVWIDPSISLTHHHGAYKFPGNFGEWLDKMNSATDNYAGVIDNISGAIEDSIKEAARA